MRRKEEKSHETRIERVLSRHRLVASLYDKRSGYYDLLVHLLSGGRDWHYRKIAVDRLQLHPGDQVLDMGCGTGMDIPLLCRRVGHEGRVVGLDLSKGMIRRAKKRLSRNLSLNISLIHGNALYLPFESKSFDAVFCDYLISTVPAVMVIKEAFRVARPGASMVFADDRLPSGWFASPLKAITGFFRHGYFNSAVAGMDFLRANLSSVKITNHHAGLIFVISGIFQGWVAD